MMDAVRFCGCHRSNQLPADGSASVFQRKVTLVGKFLLSVEQFQPVICFRTFFESDFQFADEIGTALRIFGFVDICANGRGTAQ